MRPRILSVTNFLYYGDEFLFLHRIGDVSIDKNKLNGIGGKLEEGENFLEAAKRETKEETGYVVSSKDMHFSGIVNLKEGYSQDWTMCFFTIKVSSKQIPMGNNIKEGKLLWIKAKSVLSSGFELVDDINYLWNYITSDKVFFAGFKVSEKEKIIEKNISIL